jgi:hypothetical protein
MHHPIFPQLSYLPYPIMPSYIIHPHIIISLPILNNLNLGSSINIKLKKKNSEYIIKESIQATIDQVKKFPTTTYQNMTQCTSIEQKIHTHSHDIQVCTHGIYLLHAFLLSILGLQINTYR